MDVWAALKLDMEVHRLVALTGAGGKTSTLYALARAGVDAGKKVVVTTTTHILPHPGLPLAGSPAEARALLEGCPAVTLGRFDRPDKLSGGGAPPACLASARLALIRLRRSVVAARIVAAAAISAQITSVTGPPPPGPPS